MNIDRIFNGVRDARATCVYQDHRYSPLLLPHSHHGRFAAAFDSPIDSPIIFFWRALLYVSIIVIDVIIHTKRWCWQAFCLCIFGETSSGVCFGMWWRGEEDARGLDDLLPFAGLRILA